MSERNENGISIYEKRALSGKTNNYCHLAEEHDFVEATEWANGEGWDFYIEAKNNTRHFSLTHGEFELMQILTKLK